MLALTDAMRRAFKDHGFLLLPALFSEDEIAPVRAEIETVASREGPEVVQEMDSDAVRIVYGAHRFNEAFHRLSRHPRWLGPVQAPMGGPVYIHQSRLNPKKEPHAFMVAILLDEANAANGSLMLVPGSHHYGLIVEAVDNDESPGYTLFHITEEHLVHIVDAGGIEPIIAPAGSVLICHANMVHGSAGNITPWPRRIFYLNVAATDNPPTKFERAEHHCTRDWSPIEPLGDNCLRALAHS